MKSAWFSTFSGVKVPWEKVYSMALQKFSLQATAGDAGLRLDQFLATRLPEALGQELSKGKIRKLIVAGAVYLNGRRIRIASKTLVSGARVEAYVDRQKLLSDAPSGDRAFRMSQADILFEDEYLIAVNKPAGLPTQPTLDEARDNLFAAVRRFLSERERVAQPYLGLHHRLDRDTSGVLLFTRSTEANAGVSELFSRHLAVKTYQAISGRVGRGEVPAEWFIENYLGKDRPRPGASQGKRSRFTAVRSGGDFARTDFKLLEDMKEALWVQAVPRTGRTHQIRVHLSENGLPILGDPVYGISHPAASRTLLHAVSLTFPHPIHKTEISIQSPLPEDFIQCLRALKSQKMR